MIETVNQTLTWYCKLSLGYHSTKKISFFLDPIDEFRLKTFDFKNNKVFVYVKN